MDFMQLLPQDVVLNHILNHLDLISRIRATAVCRAWRFLTQMAPPISGMPWIWLNPSTDIEDNKKKKFRHVKPKSLINLSSSGRGTGHMNRCPVWFDRLPSSSGGAYLTLTRTEPLTYTIYNAFTHDSYQLPFTGRDPNGFKHAMSPYFCQLSSKPPHCLIAARSKDGLFICKLGDDDWIKELPINDRKYYHVYDMVFHNKELYCIDDERIFAYDAEHIYDRQSFDGAPPRDVLVYNGKEDVWCTIYKSNDNRRAYYLVKSGAELLIVTKYMFVTRSPKDYKYKFTVHKLNEEHGQMELVKDFGGERMLFIGHGCSQLWSRIDSNPMNYFEKNNIYFFIYSQPIHVGKFSMDTGELEIKMLGELCPGIDSFAYNYPVWVTPTYPD